MLPPLSSSAGGVECHMGKEAANCETRDRIEEGTPGPWAQPTNDQRQSPGEGQVGTGRPDPTWSLVPGVSSSVPRAEAESTWKTGKLPA